MVSDPPSAAHAVDATEKAHAPPLAAPAPDGDREPHDVAPPSSVGEHRDLFFQLSSERLRSRARWGGALLILAPLLPTEQIAGRPAWLWQIASELPGVAIVAILAPAIAGLAIIVTRARARRITSLAVVPPIAIGAAAIAGHIGADAAAWDLLPLPHGLLGGFPLVVVGLACAAAGSNLTFKSHARKLGRWLIAVGVALVALYYALPSRGDAPIAALFRLARLIGDVDEPRLVIGLLLLLAIAFAPLFAALGTLVHLRRPAGREQSIAGLIAGYGLPGLLILLVYRALLATNGGAGVIVTLGIVAELAAILGLLTASLEVLVDAVAGMNAPGSHGDALDLPAGMPVGRAAWVASIVATTSLVGLAVLARPPAKGVDWSTHAPTEAGELLFGMELPKWGYAHLRWDDEVRERSSAQAAVTLQAAARAMRETAQTIDPGLTQAIDDLARDALATDVSGRRLFHRVVEIDEASRLAHLPFYVDPIVAWSQEGDEIRPRFSLVSYRIEATVAATVDGAPYAALRVRALGARAGHGSRLGFSRDVQPFALVVLDEIDETVRTFESLLEQDSQSCGEGVDADAQRALDECGSVLADVAARCDLRESMITMTERHELQHQVDGPHLPLSPLIERHMPGYAADAQDRANRELSAYLAEMTSAAPPKLALIHLLPFALLARGGAEHHVAIVALLAMTGRDLPRAHGSSEVDSDAIRAAFQELSKLDDDAIRARARATWRTAFGDKLPTVVVGGPRMTPQPR